MEGEAAVVAAAVGKSFAYLVEGELVGFLAGLDIPEAQSGTLYTAVAEAAVGFGIAVVVVAAAAGPAAPGIQFAGNP